jgi:hypothetical protein
MPKYKPTTAKRKQPQTQRSKLPLLLVILGAFLLLIASFFVFQKKSPSVPPEVTGGASLKVDKELVDLGDMKLGSTAKVSFEITNVGDQPLKFSKAPYIEVKEGC